MTYRFESYSAHQFYYEINMTPEKIRISQIEDYLRDNSPYFSNAFEYISKNPGKIRDDINFLLEQLRKQQHLP